MSFYMFYILIKLINNKAGECRGGEGITSGTIGSRNNNNQML
jgi:hypothetical protein